MRKRKLLVAVGAGLLLAGGGWMLVRLKEAGGAKAPPAPDKTAWNAKHEKLFLAEELKRNPTHGPILLRMAEIERSEGNLRGAREHLETGVAADGKQVDLRRELSLVDSELGDLAAAEEQSRAVLQLNPRQPDALYNLGAICANRRDFAQARQYWNQALASGGNTDSGGRARQALERLAAMR